MEIQKNLIRAHVSPEILCLISLCLSATMFLLEASWHTLCWSAKIEPLQECIKVVEAQLFCLFMFRYLKEMYALHSTTDMWQIDLWAKYEEKDLSDLWHDAVGWVLDCELCDLCGSWFPCAESINYPCLAPCPQLGHAGCGDLPQMRENWRHPNPRSNLPRPNHCHCRTHRPWWWTVDRVLFNNKYEGLVSPQWWKV